MATVNFEFRTPDDTVIARMSEEMIELVDNGVTIETYKNWKDALKALGEDATGDYAYGDKEMVRAMEGALNGKAYPVKSLETGDGKRGRGRPAKAKPGEVDVQEVAGQQLTGKVIQITPDMIKVGKNPRGETIGIDRMAESLRRMGQLQNIIVGPANKQGKHQLIAGFRRVGGATHNQEAFPGKPEYYTLNAMVYEGENPKIVAMLENLERVDMSPVAIAKQYQTLIEVDGMQQKDIAKLMIITPSTVSNYLSILKLPKAVLKLVEDSYISYQLALKMSRLSEEDLATALANVEEQLSKGNVEQATQGTQTAPKATGRGRLTVVDATLVDQAIRASRKMDNVDDEEEDPDVAAQEAADDYDPKPIKMSRKEIETFLNENSLPGSEPIVAYILKVLIKLFDGKIQEPSATRKLMNIPPNILATVGSIKKAGKGKGAVLETEEEE